MTYPDLVDALLPRISSMSVLKICLTVARQSSCGDAPTRLAVSDFEQLTGMSKQSVLNGLESALAGGWITREPNANSFWYKFETKNIEENGTRFRPKRYKNHTKTVQDLDQEKSKNHTESLQNLDRFSEGVHLSKVSKLASQPASTKIQNQDAFQEIARIVKGNGIPLLVSQDFDFEGAVDLWGDVLPKLWQNAMRFSNRKHGDQPIYRFKDACERKLDLGLEPSAKTPPPAPPAEPDENGFVIGQRYWHNNLHQTVLLLSKMDTEWYMADISEPDSGTFGKNDAVHLEYLETTRELCAA